MGTLMSAVRRVTALGTGVGTALVLAIAPPASAYPSADGPGSAAAQLSPDLLSVAAFRADDVWAVGTHFAGQRAKSTVSQHWDGQAWTTVGTPNPGKGQNALYAVSGTSGDDVWAVGYDWAGL